MAIRRKDTPLPQGHPALKCNSMSAKALQVIARMILYPAVGLDTADAYRLIENLFGIDRLQTDALALFLDRGIGREFHDETAEYLSMDEETAAEAWEDLERKGLVRRFVDHETYDEYWQVDSALETAIRRDIPIFDAWDEITGDKFTEALYDLLHPKMRRAVPRMMKPYLLDLGAPEENDDDDEVVVPVPEPPKAEAADAALRLYPESSVSRRVRSLTEGLSEQERILLYGMMGWFVEHFIKPVDESDLPDALRAAYRRHLSSLVEKGLVVSVYIWNEQEKTADSEHYRISPRCAEVFHGRDGIINVQCLGSFGTFVPCSSIEQKDLYYTESDMRTLKWLWAAADPSEYDRIVSELRTRKVRSCLSALLWGPPGTGKTELAYQLARDSGRGVFKVDTAKLNGIYIGEGAIHYTDMFQAYRYVCAVSRVCPILLMDEADGVLGQRIEDVQRGYEKDANSVQNIILEETNSLPGFFIATTNLLRNLDKAMIRRFMIRAEVHLPDAATGARLWASKFPSLSPEDAAFLGERYPLSGGNINNIVSMAVLVEVLEKRSATLEDLVSFCEDQGYGNANRERKRIGF